MWPFQRGQEKNIFFCYGFATQNKTPNMMKLVSNFLFFIKEFYGVNFKSIDNGSHATTISTIAASEIF